jgi:hypothetical protein
MSPRCARGGSLREVDAKISGRLTPEVIDGVIKMIPDAWLAGDAPGGTAQRRGDYRNYLLARLMPPRAFLEEAIDARSRDV